MHPSIATTPSEIQPIQTPPSSETPIPNQSIESTAPSQVNKRYKRRVKQTLFYSTMGIKSTLQSMSMDFSPREEPFYPLNRMRP